MPGRWKTTWHRSESSGKLVFGKLEEFEKPLRLSESKWTAFTLTWFPRTRIEAVVSAVLQHWIKPDGSLRARQLRFGWDNAPIHRWAQSQMFRSLAFLLAEEKLSA